MPKSKRFILVFTNIILLIAGVLGLLSFLALARVSRGPASGDLGPVTDVVRLQTIAAHAITGWQQVVSVTNVEKWYSLAFGVIMIVASVIHFSMAPWRKRNCRDQVA
jgi:hypothetical protein